MSDPTKGLIGKFNVSRIDGRDHDDGDRAGADYFVLDLTYDPFAADALMAYAARCEEKYPKLAEDLRKKLREGAAKPMKLETMVEVTVQPISAFHGELEFWTGMVSFGDGGFSIGPPRTTLKEAEQDCLSYVETMGVMTKE